MAYPSIYPDNIRSDPNYPTPYNIQDIKKYSFPDCIVSYFKYFEMWTPNLTSDQKKIELNRLLQDDEIAFSTYMQNINEPYEVIKQKLIEQFTESDENFLKHKKEKKKRRKMFRKMSKEEMQDYIRSTYNTINALPKEKLVLNELVRSLPRKFKRMDLENKCNSVDQVIDALSEKFSNVKLKDPEREEKKRLKKHRKHGHHHHGPNDTSSSSSSSDTSDDEKYKKKSHHHHHAKKH